MRVRFLLLAAALALAPALAPARRASAEDAPGAKALPPLLPRAVLFGNPDRANPQVSPDGKSIGFLKADDKGVLQVWVRPVGDAAGERVVTRDKKRGIRDWFWSQDSGSILYGQDEGGDENDHLFACAVANGETRDLTPIQGVKSMFVAHDRELPGELLVAMNRRMKMVFDLWKVDLATGALTMVEQNPGLVVRTIVDRQHRVRAVVVVNPAGGSELRGRGPAGDDEWKPLLKWGADESVEPLELSADAKTLYLKSDLSSDTLALEAMDLATGERTPIASDPGVDAGVVLFEEATGKPQAVSFSRDRPKWKVLDPAIAPDFAAIEKTAGGGGFGIASRDDADATWVVAYVTDDAPTRWALWDRKAQAAKPLFTSRTALEGAKLATMRPVDVTARDGLVIPTLVSLPPGVEAKALPTVVLVHGGPWARDRWGFDTQAQWLANRGYAVLQVNYRGSTGFGKKHKLAARKEFAGKMHTDLLDALDWAVKEGISDRKRVAIMGGSYGGYATLVGLTFTPDVFACGVDIVGPSNLVSLVESFPPYWRPMLVNNWFPYVGDPNVPEDRKDMEARSPLFRVDKIKAPLLVAQGANDPRVTKKEADQVVEAIRARGGAVEYVVYDDEGHGFARPENRLDFYGRAEAFLAKHLGGRSE
jgi:dipeptidyl aminopeptidase/acylaminoacyl peptidase